MSKFKFKGFLRSVEIVPIIYGSFTGIISVYNADCVIKLPLENADSLDKIVKAVGNLVEVEVNGKFVISVKVVV